MQPITMHPLGIWHLAYALRIPLRATAQNLLPLSNERPSIIWLPNVLTAGPAMDVLGGRAMLLVSFAASALCYAMTASATSLTALYLSR